MDDLTKKRTEAARAAIHEEGVAILNHTSTLMQTAIESGIDPDTYLRSVAVGPVPDNMMLMIAGMILSQIRSIVPSDEHLFEYVRRFAALMPPR